MIVSSFFPGRIRLRNEVFKDAEIYSALYSAVGNHPAVKKIERNEITGSVLLEYIPEKLPVDKILALQSELLALGKLAEFYSAKNKSEILRKIKEIESKL